MLGSYTEEQKYLLLSIRECAQPHKEICRFAAAAGAILTADFICHEYNFKNMKGMVIARWQTKTHMDMTMKK